MYCKPLALALAISFGAVSCNRGGSSLPRPTAERIAIFPVENLSGHAELLGVARALPLLIENQLSGLANLAPITVNSPSDAAAQRAYRELRGYLELNGNQLVVKLQDRTAAGKIDRILEAQSTSIGQIVNTIAHQISSNAADLKASDQALAAFANGMVNLGTLEGASQFARVTELAPNFGPAWLQFGASLWSLGKPQVAEQAWRSALGKNIDPISKARIRAELAARIESPDLAAALAELAKRLPADAEAQSRAGDAISATGNYTESARLMKAAVALEPSNAGYRNTLAYSQALSGDYNGALATITTYEQLEPKNPNPLDSKGEIQFLTRHFAEAGHTFEAVHALDPKFQAAFALRKAGEAYLLGGDPASANRVMTILTSTAPSGSVDRERFQAVWEHRTGKRQEAIERLIRIAPMDTLAANQAVVWLTQAGDRTRAAALAASIPGPSRTLLAFISQPSAPAVTWLARAQSFFSNPSQTRTALSYALALDKHWDEVATLLEPIAPRLNPLETGQTFALYRRALAESKQTEKLQTEIKRLPDFPMLPAQGPDSLFDSLIYVK